MSLLSAPLPERCATTAVAGDADESSGTRVLAVGQASVEPPLPELAFEVALARWRALAGRLVVPSYLCALVDGGGRLVGTATLPVGTALTIGRHTACELRLSEQTAPLRALAALVVPGDDRMTPILRLWDLATGQPFRTEDGVAARAVVADGPVYITTGGCGLWLTPLSPGATWPAEAGRAFRALPPRTFLEQDSPDLPRGRRAAHVSRVAPAVTLTEDTRLEPAWGALDVLVDGALASHPVSAEQLARGILVGRYDRCKLRLMDRDSQISRVHALLVRVGGAVWAIDTGSTNGLSLDGQPISAAPLGPGSRLALTERASIAWRRRVTGLA